MALTPDVVNGAVVDIAWGNQVRDRTAQVFATPAERDTQWPTPPRGALCVTVDTDTLWRAVGATPKWTAMPIGSPWVQLPLAGGWSNYGAGYQIPQYRLVGDFVQFRGVANHNAGAIAVPTPLTTALPAAYRPPATIQMAAAMGTSLVNLETPPSGIISAVGVAGGSTVSYVVMDAVKGWSVTP